MAWFRLVDSVQALDGRGTAARPPAGSVPRGTFATDRGSPRHTSSPTREFPASLAPARRDAGWNRPGLRSRPQPWLVASPRRGLGLGLGLTGPTCMSTPLATATAGNRYWRGVLWPPAAPLFRSDPTNGDSPTACPVTVDGSPTHHHGQRPTHLVDRSPADRLALTYNAMRSVPAWCRCLRPRPRAHPTSPSDRVPGRRRRGGRPDQVVPPGPR